VKLVSYMHKGKARLGAISDDQVVDLAQAWDAYRGETGGSASRQVDFPDDRSALLQSDDTTWQVVGTIAAWAEALPGSTGASLRWPLAQVRLGPPLANPSKIICVGLNYHDHCRETGQRVPDRPILFAKFPSSIVGPEDEITWAPDATQKVDYEAEFAVIVGREGRHIPADRAYDYVAGYTIVNDISARDEQHSDGQWVRGKSFDTFCPMGPCLLTKTKCQIPTIYASSVGSVVNRCRTRTLGN
jgi:2-keto-4-pentenoate hydratase/2-oxohepta-3-ene-1,7-dioic acid hydratase in catechol pathway